MNNMPIKLRNELADDPFYRACARREALQDHECQPDPLTQRLIEWEHALYFAGRQVQKIFAIVPLCWWAHRGPGLNKEINVWIALSRATQLDMLELTRKGSMDYCLYRGYLDGKYGKYDPTFESKLVVAY